MYQHILVRIRALPENLATLEELSDILDAIFRQRVPPVAAEALIDYWNMSYSRMQVPKHDWPPAIQHCLSAVGLLPEAEVEQPKEDLTVEPAFVATAPLPRTSLAASFTTPPAVLQREAFAKIQSPQRPQKMFGPFPIIPSSPVSPLLRRSDPAGRRTPLSSIQLCGSPSKRRRLAIDNEDVNDEKENLVVVSVVDRIAAMTPGVAKKRRRGEVEDEAAAEQKSGPSTKKLKSSMRPRTRSASKKGSQHASPACSVASSNESEDERRWVEATLTQMVPFPVTEAQDDACGGFSTPVLPQRKRHVRTVNNSEHLSFQGVFMPSRKKKTDREHTTSLDGSGVENPSSSSRMLDLRKRLPMRRSVSIPESMLTSKTEKKRKRRQSDANDDDESLDLYDLVGSNPLPALQLPLPPPVRPLRKAYSLPSTDSDVSSTPLSSSDDDPFIGQVTPHHLISPALQRRVSGHSLLTSKTRKTPMGLGFGERFGDAVVMPGSDESVTTSGSETESPTKGVLTRQMMRMRNVK